MSIPEFLSWLPGSFAISFVFRWGDIGSLFFTFYYFPRGDDDGILDTFLFVEMSWEMGFEALLRRSDREHNGCISDYPSSGWFWFIRSFTFLGICESLLPSLVNSRGWLGEPWWVLSGFEAILLEFFQRELRGEWLREELLIVLSTNSLWKLLFSTWTRGMTDLFDGPSRGWFKGVGDDEALDFEIVLVLQSTIQDAFSLLLALILLGMVDHWRLRSAKESPRRCRSQFLFYNNFPFHPWIPNHLHLRLPMNRLPLSPVLPRLTPSLSLLSLPLLPILLVLLRNANKSTTRHARVVDRDYLAIRFNIHSFLAQTLISRGDYSLLFLLLQAFV